jgi:hypothetical protein
MPKPALSLNSPNLQTQKLRGPGRAEFVGILDAHLRDRGFCSDMEPLLRNGINYDPQAAGSYVQAKLLRLLPE